MAVTTRVQGNIIVFNTGFTYRIIYEHLRTALVEQHLGHLIPISFHISQRVGSLRTGSNGIMYVKEPEIKKQSFHIYDPNLSKLDASIYSTLREQQLEHKGTITFIVNPEYNDSGMIAMDDIYSLYRLLRDMEYCTIYSITDIHIVDKDDMCIVYVTADSDTG
jgi:hypothetical protein